MSTLSELANQTPVWGSRQPRLHFVSFNGTWAGGVLSSRKTIVSEFVKLVSVHENVFETPVNGVGSDIGFIDRIVGGESPVLIIIHISRSQIILVGYSRGAWAARYLAMLINAVGLPKDGDEHLYSLLYKACHKNSMLTRDAAQQLLQGYDNVKFAFHCISLHETREPFSTAFMCGLGVHQVLFPGSHGNLGWIDETEGLVHGPFAWMIQQLKTHLNISFDDTQLAKRFPAYVPPQLGVNPLDQRPDAIPSLARQDGLSDTVEVPTKESLSTMPSARRQWSDGSIIRAHPGLLAIIGKKTGHAASAGVATNLKVHIGARLRTGLDDFNAVPGYTLTLPAKGPLHWKRRQQTPSQWSSSSDSGSGVGLAERIDEAGVGPLEAQLLGLPHEVVSEHCCHENCLRR
ncbi:hypothetical protein PG987_007050 [Apiospora arundinis]